MFNRKYKKGMADAAKAYDAFGKKQEEALKHILEEIRQGKKDMESALKELNGNIDGLYDYLKSKEKAKLYTVYTPFDIKNIGEQEKLFLVGALYRLTMDKSPNENQQNYLRAIQKYLEIKDPPFGTDPMAIENIEDIPTQKAILQAVLEFLSLQDGDSYDETQFQQDFLEAFSVNARSRQEIMNHIELLYTATGAKGLAEKYGYVAEEDLSNEEENTSDVGICFEKFSEDSFEKILIGKVGCRLGDIIETEHFILAQPAYFYDSIWYEDAFDSAICVDKKTGKIDILKKYRCLQNPQKLLRITNVSDTIAIWYNVGTKDGHIGIFDLKNKQYTEIDHGHNMQLLCTQNNYIVYFKESNTGRIPNQLFIYDMISQKTRLVCNPSEEGHFKGMACIDGNNLYVLGWQYSRDILLRVKLDDNLIPEILFSISNFSGSGYCAFMKAQESHLYLLMKGSYGAKLFCIDINDENKELRPAAAAKTLSTQIMKCIVGDTEKIDNADCYDDLIIYTYKNNGRLEAYKWNSEEKICLAENGASAQIMGLGYKFYYNRLGNLVYFETIGAHGLCKVRINAPLQIELVRPQNS